MQIADLIATLKIESTPRGARIMVLPFVQARHGFIVDTEENRELPECGVVIALGPGGTAPESGRPIPVVSTVGDVVWFGKYAGLLTACETPMGPAKVFLMQESEVLMSLATGFELEVHDDNPRKAHRKGLICEHCDPIPVNLERLQAIAAGDIIDLDAEVDDEPSPLIAQERERLIAERQAAEDAPPVQEA